ncbi:MAG: hypothetical protein KAV42_11240 [Candidatus Krumholzibacteria bacterium]|nr:hypothetical protein [Candidatus Krumholzibacteria bacterium]
MDRQFEAGRNNVTELNESSMSTLSKVLTRGLDVINKSRVFFSVFAALIVLHMLMMWHVRIYPFVDLPNHLAKATIYRYYGESANQFDDYYAVDIFPKPNVFHLLFTGSRLFPSVESANRLLMTLYVVLLPFVVLLIIRKVKGNQWFSMLSFLCLYNLNLGWGFIDYAISIPFLLLWFYFLVDYHDHRSIRNRIMISALFLLLFFMHAITSLFSLLIYFIYCIYRYRTSLQDLVKELLVCVPLTGMLFVWWNIDSQEGQSTIRFLMDYYSNDYVPTILVRGKHLLTYDNTFLLDGFFGNMTSTVFSAFIVLFCVWALFKNWKKLAELIKKSTLPYILFFCAMFCYFFLPPGIQGNGALHERFSVFVLLSMIILVSILYSKKLNNVLIVTICLMCLFYSILWVDYFLEFQRENESFTQDMLDDTGGGKLVGLIYDQQYRGQPVYIHFPNYNIVWNRAITATNIIDYPFGSVRRTADYDSLPRYDEWIGIRDNKWWDEYFVFDYLLVRGEVPEEVIPLHNEYGVVENIDKWSLYRKHHIQ